MVMESDLTLFGFNWSEPNPTTHQQQQQQQHLHVGQDGGSDLLEKEGKEHDDGSHDIKVRNKKGDFHQWKKNRNPFEENMTGFGSSPIATRPDWKKNIPQDVKHLATLLEAERPWVGNGSLLGNKLPPSRETKERKQQVQVISSGTATTAPRQLEPLEKQQQQQQQQHDEGGGSKQDKFQNELTRHIEGFNDLNDHDLVSDALKRLSLHQTIEKDLRKEEVKISIARSQLRSKLAESTAQVIRGLIQLIQRYKQRIEELTVSQRVHAGLEDRLVEFLNMVATEVENKRNGGELNRDTILEFLKESKIAKEYPRVHGATTKLTEAIELFAAQSGKLDLSQELTTLQQIADARKLQVDKAKRELEQMDQRMRTLKNQVSLGQEQRSHALEQATTQAYVRATQQYQSEINRLKTEKDSLSMELRLVKTRCEKYERRLEKK